MNISPFFSALALMLLIFQSLSGQTLQRGIQAEHRNSNRVRSGIAMGGIGAGCFEIRKDGQFYNWNIMNNWPLGTGQPFEIKAYPRNGSEQSVLFFLVRYQVEGERPRIKLLQLNNGMVEGGMESIDYYYPWMSGIDRIAYSASFPFSKLQFSDPDMPLLITLNAFSPFIPHDRVNSSIPGVYFNFKVEATGDRPVKVFLVSSLRNLVGYDVTEKYFTSQAHEMEDVKGFSMSCGDLHPEHTSYGQMSMFSLSAESSYYLGWEHKHPYYEKLLVDECFEDVDDTESRNQQVGGQLRGRMQLNNKDQRCFSSIGVDRQLLPGEHFDHSFVFSWYFPNLYGGISERPEEFEGDWTLGIKPTRRLGHFYENQFSSALEVGRYLVDHKASLEERSRRFQDDFYDSSLKPFVLNQVNSQLNTFITSSIYTKKGSFAIREGMSPHKPWGPYGTIDVSLYGSSSIVALFPELQKSLMHAHRRIQSDAGEIHHGLQADVDLELNGTWGVFHRIDLVPNYIQIVLRDFFWTGDREYLEAMWPSVKKGIHYILNERDQDGDRMPDMHGIMCSYDNFPMYGLASYIQSQWLAAMASVSRAAGILGDRETGKLAEDILKEGRQLMEEKLWNGSYYMLSNDYQGERGEDPGVLTDQLIGQWLAHQSGLGHLLEEARIQSALQEVMAYSYLEGFGLRNCTWPATPELYPIEETNLWVDQANTCWTGVELGFAALLLHEGMVKEAEAVIHNVDERYRKAGLYWDHQEFGGHYYRPMSAWGILHGYLGLGIQDGSYFFHPNLEGDEYKLFFATGRGTAHYVRQAEGIYIEVCSGTALIRELQIEDRGMEGKRVRVSLNGAPLKAKGGWKDGKLSLSLPELRVLQDGDRLELNF